MRQGEKTDFWNLILQSIDDSIEHIRKEQASDIFEDLPAEQYKVQNELLKAKIKYLEQMKNQPSIIIEDVENPDEEKQNFDPYSIPKDFEKSINKS